MLKQGTAISDPGNLAAAAAITLSGANTANDAVLLKSLVTHLKRCTLVSLRTFNQLEPDAEVTQCNQD